MGDQLKGLLITTLGVLCIVPDSLFVRLIDGDPMVTTFWRSLISGSVVLAAVLMFPGLGSFRSILRTGWPGFWYTVLIASTAPAFVLAVSNTSVANVVFIFASMPVFASVYSRLFLGEPISRRMILTMAAVFCGLAVLAYGSHTNEVASWKGDVWALYISASYAAALTLVRKLKETPMIPAIPIAFIGTAVLIGLFQAPLPAFVEKWPLFLGHGLFIGLATCLLTIGPRYISSAEVALLILLESVLAPLLVWALVGEDPGAYAVSGGVIVIGALLMSNLVAMRARQRRC
ncbi:DMT family transporter [Roseibium hamelinense]|nr:DMT family transporter [Roseibium hamelinense]